MAGNKQTYSKTNTSPFALRANGGKKNWVVTLAIWGEVTPGAILIKCDLWRDMVDVITCAIFGDCRLRGVGVVRGVSLPSHIDLTRRPYNTGHTTVWSCDYSRDLKSSRPIWPPGHVLWPQPRPQFLASASWSTGLAVMYLGLVASINVMRHIKWINM